MDELSRLDAAFQRLLFDPRLRASLRAGDRSALGPDADAFARLDLDELDRLAAAVRDGLVRGSLGGLGLADAFPATITALGGDPAAVVERFLADTGGAAVDGRPIDATGRRAGVSVLEAFHGWADAALPDPAPRARAQHELAAALLAALARTPRPGFLVGWPLVHLDALGGRCVLDAARPLAGPDDPPDDPVVYVAAAGRYASGRLSRPLAALVLEPLASPPRWTRECLAQQPPDALDAARRALAARGLR
jgi:hypothetical protein